MVKLKINDFIKVTRTFLIPRIEISVVTDIIREKCTIQIFRLSINPLNEAYQNTLYKHCWNFLDFTENSAEIITDQEELKYWNTLYKIYLMKES